jgi:hypothetical protein
MILWRLGSHQSIARFQSRQLSNILYDTDRLRNELKVTELIDGSYFIEHPVPKTIYNTLPQAVVISKNKKYPIRPITEQEIAEMKKLRLEQPDYWTQKRLSEKFQLSTICIAMHAPCPSERKERLMAERHKELCSMGYKKKLAWLYRQRYATSPLTSFVKPRS